MKTLNELVGEFVLMFGSLEHTLHHSIIQIVMKHYTSSSEKSFEIIDLLLRGNEFSKNLTYLRYFINNVIEDKHRSEWENFIKDIDKLMLMRNTIAHQMSGVSDDELNLLKRKVNVSLKSTPKYLEITIEDLQLVNKLLQERYRQLFDSLVETPFFEKNGLSITWVNQFPQLHI